MSTLTIPRLRNLLMLWRAPGIGCTAMRHIIQQYDKLAEISTFPSSVLSRLGLTQQTIDYLRKPDWAGVERDLAWLQQPGHYLIDMSHEHYPNLLKQIPQSPGILFVKGNPAALNNHQLAIVGSRNPTPRGSDTAQSFGYELSRAGLIITSGLAIGIDAAAHRGAVQAKNPTIAVMGCGIDQVYPKRHQRLAEQILANGGALVSEFPCGVQALPEHFPQRNRIVSGLAMGTLVVEATPRSGSLITARLAVEQGREVFAIPGSIHNPLSRGCHALLRQGAKLVETIEDIVEELTSLMTFNTVSSNARRSDAKQLKLDDESRMLLEYIGHEPMTVDRLVAKTGLTPQRIAQNLIKLEMEELVGTVAGGYIRR